MRLRVLTIPLLSALVMALLGPINVAQAGDYRSTPQGKLDSARDYVKQFLVDDANPKEVFFTRDTELPVWKDYPIYDCSLRVVVRAIEQRGEPRFESRKQDVVLVPVVAEVLTIDAFGSGGPKERPGVEGGNWCGFEYERYNFVTRRFEPVPGFLQQEHNISFKSWGEYQYEWQLSPLPEGIPRNIRVAVDADKRYVRYIIRVRVTRDKPYRIWPQVPRHWYVGDAIDKTERVMKETTDMLARGQHDLGSSATAGEVEQRQRELRVQNQDRAWKLRKYRQALESLKHTVPFADMDVHR